MYAVRYSTISKEVKVFPTLIGCLLIINFSLILIKEILHNEFFFFNFWYLMCKMILTYFYIH